MAAQMAGTLGGETSRKTTQPPRKLREQPAQLDPVVPATSAPEEGVPTLKLRTRRRRKFEVQLPGCPEDMDSELLEQEHV